MMKRITISLITAAFTLMTIGYVQSETPKSAAPKAGKALIKSLPKEIEGVELKAGKVSLKAGYQFVKQRNGSVTVARMKGGGGGGGGLGVGGTWNCSCGGIGKGSCTAVFTSGNLSCYKSSSDTCNSSCELTVTTKAGVLGVMAY